jgi:predicted Holliday junction resolvase-like endonuclease
MSANSVLRCLVIVSTTIRSLINVLQWLSKSMEDLFEMTRKASSLSDNGKEKKKKKKKKKEWLENHIAHSRKALS